jgi:hypothetical protein
MYNYSEDDGQTWTEPFDLLQNTDLWMAQPHIACDSKNNLYITYTHDYLGWTTTGRVIKMLTYDGHQWSEPIIISEGMPGSHYPKVVIDEQDKLFVFWGYYSESMHYRYFENNTWSSIYCPYCDSTDSYYFSDGHATSNNLMHWVGSSLSVNYYGERPQYYDYSISVNQWDNPEQISNDTIVVDIDISLNKFNTPECVYRKKSTISVGVVEDSTMYVKKSSNAWCKPEMVSGRNKQQFSQQIAVDQNNDTHIVEDNKTVTGDGLEHFIKQGNMWVGQYIDTCFALGFPKLLFNNNKLYCVYGKTWEVEKEVDSDLFFTKYDIITSIKQERNPSPELKIYPNPSHGNVHIEFENNKQQHIDLSVYDMTGKHIITLVSETRHRGLQRLLWKGTDKNRKEDAPRLYLVRLISGRNTATQTVEIIR